ncbi:hypothetical protein [uncultured Aquimarina sp.]|uniref:sacsin N-terminal ATP-binding-like domain-containing protein n=1 Tax=uncultured Aquimarina sp. TaxID=575652 RepID=UPI00260D045B|nr:hypothetical protein [uncultured Aquimarina sp.]
MSTYKAKIQESKEEAHSQHIATKILDLMEKLRLRNTENSKRRWVWELIQNAKDVSYDEQGISINIKFDKDEKVLKFSHNGKPFGVKNIIFLIEQVSSKDRDKNASDKPQTTGKFGTGFLTTHLLSEKVVVSSFLKEPGQPYKQFEILLDRSGRDINEVTAQVDKAFSKLNHVVDSEDNCDYREHNYNTHFKYELNDKSINVAEYGLQDLYRSLPLVLVFCDGIEKIVVQHENLEFKIDQDIELLNEEVKIHSVKIKKREKEEKVLIATLTEEFTTIAIEIEKDNQGQILVKNLGSDTPRLFCSFPLIGTESFPFPVIVNNPLFNPTEPRDGVFLTDSDEPKIIQNKDIIETATELYIKLLNFASSHKWKNPFNLIQKLHLPPNDLISEYWYDTYIKESIYDSLNDIPIVDLENGDRISIKNDKNEDQVYFPYHSSKETRLEIWQHSNKLYPNNTPKKEDIHKWYDVLWPECYKEEHKTLIEDIEKLKTLSNLSEKLKLDEGESIYWLERFHKFVYKEESYKGKIFNHKIFPNQNDDFCIGNNLFGDDEIDGTLKEISKSLSYDIKSLLFDTRISSIIFPESRTWDNKHIANKISELIEPELKEVNRSDEIQEICQNLYLWFNKNTELAKSIFKTLYKRKHLLYNDDLIIENMKKAEELDIIMEECDISDLADLKAILKSNKVRNTEVTNNELDIHESITQDVLLSYGITSEGQLQEMMADVKFSNRFIHKKTSTPEMLNYVQKLISRSKRNVIEYLKTLGNYGEEWEDAAPTVINGEKDKKPISIVVRPSDNREVYFFYTSERDTLEDSYSELWIEDGKNTPQNLTLGKILKKTGITKIVLDG